MPRRRSGASRPRSPTSFPPRRRSRWRSTMPGPARPGSPPSRPKQVRAAAHPV